MIEKEKQPQPKNCGAILYHCIIDADKMVYPCCRLMGGLGDNDKRNELLASRYSYGVLSTKKNITDIFYSKKAGKLRQLLFNIPACENCEMCDRYKEFNENFSSVYEMRKRGVFL
jgi:hypothetical protein